MKKEKEIKKKDQSEVSQPQSITDMDEFQPMDDQDSLPLPRLVLAQGGRNNPIIKDGLAKEGDLINSLSKDNYGQEIEIVPLVELNRARIRWRSREEGGGMLCIARDGQNGQGDPGGECRNCQFFKDHHSDTGCTLNYQLIAMIRDRKEPIVLSGNSIKPSDKGIRDMLAIARINAGKGFRLYQKSYILKVISATTRQYEFFKLSCVPGNNNQPLPQDEFEFMAKQKDYFKSAKVNADYDEGGNGSQEQEDEVPKDW